MRYATVPCAIKIVVGDAMRVAEYELNEAMQAYCAQAIQNMPDVELKACVKGMPMYFRCPLGLTRVRKAHVPDAG